MIASGRLATALLAASLSACGADAPAIRPTETALDPRRYFPLEVGTIWSYDVREGDALPTFATVRILESTPEGVSMQRNQQEPDLIVASAEGIRKRGSEGWILRAPLEVGTTYLGEGGRSARIDALDASVRTGMGELHDCIRVVEHARETGIEVTTSFCPDVGPASVTSSITLDETGERIEVRATLIGMTRAESSR